MTPSPTTGARPVGVGRAGAKTILFGEHAVVFGQPAIAVPVSSLPVTAQVFRSDGPLHLDAAMYHGPVSAAPDRLGPPVVALRAALAAVGAPESGLRIRVDSEIPAERGLGSSAAVAAAIVSAVADAHGRELTSDELFALTQEAERAAHGRPSGLDARTVVSTSPVWFDGGTAHPLPVGAPLWFVLADTGIAGRTKEAVAHVRERVETDGGHASGIIERLGALSSDARDALRLADPARVGAAMDEAHALLTDLGVGDPALDRLTARARHHGARGAKLTGGGRGGCIVAVARDEEHATALAALLRADGAPAAWITTVEATP